MKIRRTQTVLITFAFAAWLGAVLELGAAAGCRNDVSTCQSPGACE
jgi:hypothetical protein